MWLKDGDCDPRFTYWRQTPRGTEPLIDTDEDGVEDSVLLSQLDSLESKRTEVSRISGS